MQIKDSLFAKRVISPIDGPYVQWNDKKYLDFSSSDFLGLAQHPDVKKNAIRHTLKNGTSCSKDISLIQKQTEEKLARKLGFAECALFASFAEILALLPTAVSGLIIDASLSYFSFAPRFYSLNQLQTLCAKLPGAMIIANAHGFSIDSLVAIKNEHKTQLCLDDSDAFGILGVEGFGLSAKRNDIDWTMASLAKGGGCAAAFFAYKEHPLIASPLSISPGIAGALDAVASLLPDLEQERQTVASHAVWLYQHLAEAGITTSSPSAPHPSATLQFANPADQKKCLDLFLQHEILPALPSETELSLIVTALHTPDDLDQLASCLKKLSTLDFALAIQSPTLTPDR